MPRALGFEADNASNNNYCLDRKFGNAMPENLPLTRLNELKRLFQRHTFVTTCGWRTQLAAGALLGRSSDARDRYTLIFFTGYLQPLYCIKVELHAKQKTPMYFPFHRSLFYHNYRIY